MYTEFHFNVELKKDLPYEVSDVLDYMVGNTSEFTIMPPDHPLFYSGRWEYMLRCDSAYFPHEPASSFYTEYYDNSPFLNVRCNFKNYNDEIEKFLNWIAPYVDDHNDNFLGFYRYEEAEEPTLIYLSDYKESK